MTNPVDEFAYKLDPALWAKEVLGFKPYEWQEDFLRDTHPRIIMNCPRGAGKSLLTAIVALHSALYMPPKTLTLMFSRSNEQAMELFKKVLDFYKGLEEKPLGAITESQHKLVFDNGSRIISRPSTVATSLGFHDVTLLVIDEAAMIEDEDLYTRSRAMLDHKRGRLFLLSTPWGKSGFFYEEWQDWLTNPETAWHGVSVSTAQCPYMTKEFLAQERQKLPKWLYESEYEGQFGESSGSFFTTEEWLNALSKDVKPLFDPITGELDVPIPDKPIKKGMIGLGWEL